MKNKDKYDLTDLDYIEEEDSIRIIHLGYHNETIAIVDRYFDELHFHTFLRWLEETDQ